MFLACKTALKYKHKNNFKKTQKALEISECICYSVHHSDTTVRHSWNPEQREVL